MYYKTPRRGVSTWKPGTIGWSRLRVLTASVGVIYWIVQGEPRLRPRSRTHPSFVFMRNFMLETYKNRFRIRSARLLGYDYSQPGAYFVTVCTKDRIPYFGMIRNGEMAVSGIGGIVREEILRTPEVRVNVDLDEWVIMPNHIHMIIQIGDSSAVETPRRGVSTWKLGTLGAIMNQFKSVCTKRIRVAYPESGFAWQSRFYDHVVRDAESLRLVREYIRKNPSEWQYDEDNPEFRPSPRPLP